LGRSEFGWLVNIAARLESCEDGVVSLPEGACAEPECRGDVVGVRVVKQHCDDRSVTVIHAGCQLIKPVSNRGQEVLLPGGDTSDRSGRLIRGPTAIYNSVCFGDDRHTGQPLVNPIGIDQHTRWVAQALDLIRKVKAVTGEQRRGDEADTGCTVPGDSDGLLGILDGRDHSDALLAVQQPPDVVARRTPIVSDQHIDVARAAATASPGWLAIDEA
jgi:hypothetical protein